MKPEEIGGEPNQPASEEAEKEEFAPETLTRFCRGCQKNQVFERVYRLYPVAVRGMMDVEFELSVEPQPYAYCRKCRIVIFDGPTITEAFEKMKKLLEEAGRAATATSGLVIPGGTLDNLIIPRK